jgi:transposase
MAKVLIDDKLWEEIASLLPKHKKRRFRFPGRKPIDDRKALNGIVFILISGIPWNMLPQEMGCGSGMSCWRRLRDWQKHHVWQGLHKVLLDKLGNADKIDWSRAIADSASIRSVGAGEKKWSFPRGSTKSRKQTSYYYRRRRRALGVFSHWSTKKRHDATFVDGR